MDILLSDKLHTNFIKRRYPAEYIDEHGKRKSTWEARFPIELLDKIKADIGDDAYEVEFLCQAVEVGNVFQPKRDIHFYRDLPVEISLTYQVLVQCDPALSGTNDYTAIGVFIPYIHDRERVDFGKWCDNDGVPFGEGSYSIIIALFCRQAGIDETIQACYDLFDQFNGTEFHCDGSVDKEIVFDRFFSQFEAQTGKRLPVKFDKFQTSKDARIKALQPHMQRKRVLFPPHESDDVLTAIKQLTRYGKSREHDDAPDMIAAAVENLDPNRGFGKVGMYII
jgi:predicted phage terminase large subunit-like protein